MYTICQYPLDFLINIVYIRYKYTIFYEQEVKFMVNPSEYLKIAEVAEILGVTRRTVYRRIWANEIPASKIGGLYYIKKSDLESLLNQGKPSSTEHETRPSSLTKCGNCLRILKSYDQFSKQCATEGCDKIICDQCAHQGISFCKEHAISSTKKLFEFQQMLQNGEIDLLLKGSEARLREINFLNRIYTRFSQINTILHPISQELLTIQDWDEYLEKSDQRATVLKLKNKVMLDAKDLAQTPINPTYRFIIPPQKRQSGPSFEIKISVISRLEEMVQDGFDIQPMTFDELMVILEKLGEENSTNNLFQIIVMAATTGWDTNARSIIRGGLQGKSETAYFDPKLFLYLFDLETNELIYNQADERMQLYVELFTPLLVTEEVKAVMVEIENLLASRGHGSLALSEAVKSLPYSERILKLAFEKLLASNRYKQVDVPDLGGLVIFQK